MINLTSKRTGDSISAGREAKNERAIGRFLEKLGFSKKNEESNEQAHSVSYISVAQMDSGLMVIQPSHNEEQKYPPVNDENPSEYLERELTIEMKSDLNVKISPATAAT